LLPPSLGTFLWATIVVGFALLALGGWLVSGREVHTRARVRLGGAPTQRLRSMFGYCVAYALASLSCTIGPFLAVTASSAPAPCSMESPPTRRTRSA
jgi:hypothetical protein